MTEPAEPAGPRLAQTLSLWDAVNLIVGIVVAASIFRMPPLVFGNLPYAWQGLAVWLVGGLLALCGALCYAELATSLPRSGGDYVYLTRAYSPLVGFLFGWAHLTGILTGSIGALAYIFADYTAELTGWGPQSIVWLAAAAVIALTLLNLGGVVFGKLAQNVLTSAKILGLIGIAVCGFLWGDGLQNLTVTTEPQFSANWGLALIFVLYAYGGWNDAVFVAAEVQNRERNLPWALAGGVGLVAIVYLVVNAAYLNGLGLDGVRSSQTPAADVLRPALGDIGHATMCVLVIISVLGGLNGLILTGSRVHASLGADHRVFAWLGKWRKDAQVPTNSLITQSAVAVLLVIAVGSEWGRDGVDSALAAVRLDPVDWTNFGGGFDALVAATAPVFWFFFLLTGFAVIVLRDREPDLPRPFRVPLFPELPIVFCLTCGYMLWSSIEYAGRLSLLGGVPLLLGFRLYSLSRRLERK